MLHMQYTNVNSETCEMAFVAAGPAR